MLRDRIRDENGNLLRGLSRNQICIGVATDKKHTICFLEGFGKPSQKRSYDTFKNHIASGSTLIHDKEKAHKKLVEKLDLKSVSYSSSDLKGLADSENPLDPVNRIHCLLKMFLNAHSGFCRDEIQDYLIAYFSRADENYFGGAMRYVKVGNTEIVCNDIMKLLPADSFKIEMTEPYSPVYMTCIDEAKKDLQAKARPSLRSLPDSIDAYDTVILAYPNYWGTMPMAVYTFLEAFDFSGKTILPLCTNEGSGMGISEKEIKKVCPGAIVRKGLPITGSHAALSGAQVEIWLKANALI